MRDVREFLKNFFSSRLFVVVAVFVVLFAIILGRVFTLQIVNGKSYQDNFAMRIERTLSINAARGNIYDCNGNLLAYNELAYSVTITDSATYSKTSEKNLELNAELAEILTVLEENDETLTNTFKIDYDADTGAYSFNVSGTALDRFLADIFGYSSADDLQYNEDFGFDEKNATAAQVMEYLKSDTNFGVDASYPEDIAYGIVVIRYAMQSNYYTRYRATTIAEDVSDKTVAYMNEHMDTLVGVAIEEDTIRRYNYSEYFSSIIGYTGKISDSEYEELSATDDSYTSNDIIGKAGLEQYYESYLRGVNGEEKVYVDNLGRVSEVISSTDSVAGNDLYLTIDADLQKAVYEILEMNIAGIVYSNIKDGNIPMDDVYFALIDNSVIDINHLDADDATDTEKELYADFSAARDVAIDEIKDELYDNPIALSDMSDETLDDFTQIMSVLRDSGLLLSDEIDESDETYKKWKNMQLSPKEYLTYCISQHWIDISLLDVDEKYADSSEIYDTLCDYMINELYSDTDFSKIVYQYMVERGELSKVDICIILLEQGVLDYDDNTLEGLRDGTISPNTFLLDKINNIEITPAQLALDPCTGSCVITDTKTGEIKALVSYPGYDNNRLANGVDSDYYASLLADNSTPMWNKATQEQTAPGSTFKMVTATAALAEGIISTTDEIQCTGIFYDIDNQPKCWIYPSTHGYLNVSEAIRDSCNVFFYTLGYRMAQKDTGIYNDANGIAYIQKYASLYGLDSDTGIEIAETTSSPATEYPVMAAIGQSDNSYTTVALSRYVTAVATGKLYDYQLMGEITDGDGETIVSHESTYTDISGTLNASQWYSIRNGMRLVAQTKSELEALSVSTAGKTGTAQESDLRPNHALFLGYAPYGNPEISIALRIAYGYSSSNAVTAASNILSYYFGDQTLDEILGVNASGVNGTSTNEVTD